MGHDDNLEHHSDRISASTAQNSYLSIIPDEQYQVLQQPVVQTTPERNPSSKTQLACITVLSILLLIAVIVIGAGISWYFITNGEIQDKRKYFGTLILDNAILKITKASINE